MQLKRNKEMEFETLKKSHKKQVIISALAVCIIGGVLTYATSRAFYKVDGEIDLAKGIVNYSVPDMRVVAISVSEDGTNYNIANEVPTGEYTLNVDKTICKVATETSGIENAPKDNNITIEYKEGKINFLGIIKRNTRCYLYFDKVLDTEKPIISDITTSATKTEINVTITASDNKGVTEYWYQIGSNAAIKGTGNTYKFTGLTAGTTYSVKVYVKDAAGNQSDITTKSVTTTPNNITMDNLIAGLGAKTTTPNFASTATTDEGVYAVSDGMYGGTSYYWRGVATTNYVKFAGFCWRIVRINGDKTIRLIYDGTTCHANGTSTAESIAKTSQAYNSSYTRSEYVGWTYSTGSQRTLSGTASNAKSQTESWYNSNIIGTNASKVADGKFCNDRNVASGYSWSSQPSNSFHYVGRERLYTNKTPTLSCTNSNDVYTLKVGAITADEIAFAGGVFGLENNKFYLYNNQNYWTMTPSFLNSINSGIALLFRMGVDGKLENISVANSETNIRPVINLRSDIIFSSGNGTLSNPYVVS